MRDHAFQDHMLGVLDGLCKLADIGQSDAEAAHSGIDLQVHRNGMIFAAMIAETVEAA